MSIVKLLASTILALISATAIAQSTKVVVIPLGGGNEMTVITASINANVTVARSNDTGLSVNRDGSLGVGDYVITTSTDISSCAYTATLGTASSGAGPLNGQITARPSTSGNNALYIRTSDSSGVKANKPFHVIIMCG